VWERAGRGCEDEERGQGPMDLLAGVNWCVGEGGRRCEGVEREEARKRGGKRLAVTTTRGWKVLQGLWRRRRG